jgi:spermidine synthase
MKKWSLLEEAKTPDGSLMTLHTHDGAYVIRVNGRELMSTRHFASEEKLAEFACLPVSNRTSPRVLIGGLGLGFTLRAALKSLPPKSEVVVAELMPEVVAWNRNPDYGLAAECLADPRTKIEMGDVADIIARTDSGFDAIMLDVDNGTTAMSTDGNKNLYQRQGLANIWKALRPAGLVVFWSAQEEPLFAKQMQKAGYKVDIRQVRAHATGGSIHTLLLGRKGR